MAFGTPTGGVAGSDKTAGTSVVTAAFTRTAGRFYCIAIAKDNAASADGNTSEVTSITDSQGNTWTKAREFCNAEGGAGAGVTISLWYSVCTTGGSATLTLNFSGSVTAKAWNEIEATIGAGSTISVAGGTDVADDGVNPSALTLSGLASQEYLFVRAAGAENTALSTTQTANYTERPDQNTTGGGAASNINCWLEHRVFTGTGDTSDPTGFATTWASVYVAFKETAGGPAPLAAASGAFSLTGTAAGLRAARKLSAASGAFALTGGAAALRKGYTLNAQAGAFALAGQAAGLRRTYAVAAAAGAFTLTGGAAGLARGLKLPAASGAFALTGQAANLRRGFSMAAASGAFVLSGQTVTFRRTYALAAAAGAYSVTGQVAGLRRGLRLSAVSGAFVLTGQDATLTTAAAKILAAASGGFVLTGQPATLRAARGLAAASGAFSWAGQAATLRFSRKIAAEAGAFTLAGQPSGLRVARRLAAASGSFTETGAAAALRVHRRLVAEAGVIAWTGFAATLTKGTSSGLLLVAEPGAFDIAGADATLSVRRRVWAPIGPTGETWTRIPPGPDVWS